MDPVAKIHSLTLSRMTDSSALTYKNSLRYFARWLCISEKVRLPRPIQALRYLFSLERKAAFVLLSEYQHHMYRGLARKTVNLRMAVIHKAVWNAGQAGLIEWGDLKIAPVKQKRGDKKDMSGPDEVEFGIFIETMRKGPQYPVRKRDITIALLMYYLGLRTREVRLARIEDFSHDSWEISVSEKGAEYPVRLNVPEPCRKDFSAWMEIRGTGPGPLFPVIENKYRLTRRTLKEGFLTGTFKNIREKSGIKSRANPHAVRHSAINRGAKIAAENGLGIDYLMGFSRHRSPASLGMYLDSLEKKGRYLASLTPKDDDIQESREHQEAIGEVSGLLAELQKKIKVLEGQSLS